jgi:hypothetical protein
LGWRNVVSGWPQKESPSYFVSTGILNAEHSPGFWELTARLKRPIRHDFPHAAVTRRNLAHVKPSKLVQFGKRGDLERKSLHTLESGDLTGGK